jgi:hypothetical protein
MALSIRSLFGAKSGVGSRIKLTIALTIRLRVEQQASFLGETPGLGCAGDRTARALILAVAVEVALSRRFPEAIFPAKCPDFERRDSRILS